MSNETMNLMNYYIQCMTDKEETIREDTEARWADGSFHAEPIGGHITGAVGPWCDEHLSDDDLPF